MTFNPDNLIFFYLLTSVLVLGGAILVNVAGTTEEKHK